MGGFFHARESPEEIMLLREFSDWVFNQIIQNVPDDIGTCEFDCSRGQCSQGEWEMCKRRLNRAEGELMPAEETRQEPAA